MSSSTRHHIEKARRHMPPGFFCLRCASSSQLFGRLVRLRLRRTLRENSVCPPDARIRACSTQFSRSMRPLKSRQGADAVDILARPVGHLLVSGDAERIQLLFNQHADAADALQVIEAGCRLQTREPTATLGASPRSASERTERSPGRSVRGAALAGSAVLPRMASASLAGRASTAAVAAAAAGWFQEPPQRRGRGGVSSPYHRPWRAPEPARSNSLVRPAWWRRAHD